ncbi:hypothetical protein ACQEU3_06420 [Spirillospora sp. CA-253888]
MALPPARSIAEVHAYIDMLACECGSHAYEVITVSPRRKQDGSRPCEYELECDRCERRRVLMFSAVGASDSDGFGAGRSELIDAGEWMWYAERLGDAVPAKSWFRRRKAEDREMLDDAIAAVDEVLKFLPPGADTVPDVAFWTERGRKFRGDPSTSVFNRRDLEAVRAVFVGQR